MLKVIETRSIRDEDAAAMKLAKDVEDLFNSLEVGVAAIVGKEGLLAEDLSVFCSSYKGAFEIVFREEKEHFEVFKIPKGLGGGWVKNKIAAKQSDLNYEETISKFINVIKKHISEYLELPLARIKKYELNPRIEDMRNEKVISYAYIQRKNSGIMRNDKFLRSSVSIKHSHFLHEVLKRMIDLEILVELDRRYAANFNSTARLFGINVENLK